MSKLTISVFGNKIFSEIIDELKLFSGYKIVFYNDFDLCLANASSNHQLIIFFLTKKNKTYYEKINKVNFPLIIVNESVLEKKIFNEDFIEKLNIPFSILDLQKSIISLISKYEFKKSSLISLGAYTLDKNERKIKKDNISLQLTEKEISFLVLFSKNNKPITKDFVLKYVWKYSSESETHTNNRF